MEKSEILSLFSQNAFMKKANVNDDQIKTLLQHWQEPHRYWHGITHLSDLLHHSQTLPLSTEEKHQLEIAILFHDIIYDPRNESNEEDSANFFTQFFSHVPMPGSFLKNIHQAILETKTGQASFPFSKHLISLDRSILSESNLAFLISYEHQIQKEFQYVSWPVYQKNRIQFLESIINKKSTSTAIQQLISYVQNYRPRIGIYAGSFDPFHKGHLNILEKAEKQFDKVIIAPGINPEKNSNNQTSRVTELKKVLPFHEIRPFTGLLTDLAQEIMSDADVTIVRGLRDGYDLQYELNQARFMEDLFPQIQIIYLSCNRELDHISSGSIRGLKKFNPELAKSYLPDKYAYANSTKKTGNKR